ncbi:HAMP domain-containing histidine kinase [Natronococcus pandeyae]|uniref:HAMP domain-containing histidine kinase n=1 Tax=Natronococcus pandeyae TaxID=2055836 RepID=UPI0016531C6B|nr:HAMP domain-containing histidine kinase [Natronococcus pandeyae]
MTTIVLYVAATESDALEGAAALERAASDISVAPAVSLDAIRERAPAADCVVFAETPTTAEGSHLLEVVDACDDTPLVLYADPSYAPTTARATDGIEGYVRRDGDRSTVHLADEIRWVSHEPASDERPSASSGDETATESAGGTDRTHRKRVLAAQRDRLEEIDRLVDGDLRERLSLAQGYLEIARETNDPDHVAAVEAAHERLGESLDALSTLSRRRDVIAAVEPVALHDIARRAWARLDEPNDRTLHLEEDRVLEADKERLADLLERLFLRSGSAGRGPEPMTIHVGASSNGFFVGDDGDPPLESEGEKRLERGDDLALVGRIANAHGWSVSIGESDEGGTRVDITGTTVDWENAFGSTSIRSALDSEFELER